MSTPYTELLKKTTRLADAAPIPEPEFPDFLKQFRKKYNIGGKINLQSLPASVQGILTGSLGNSIINQSGFNIQGGGAAGGSGGTYTGGGLFKSGKKWVGTTGSSYWDTGRSGMGDTGMPAGGQGMSVHQVSSPWLPTGTELNIRRGGKTVRAYVGDIGPGRPQYKDMLDLSAPLAAYLTGNSIEQARRSTMHKIQFQVASWGTGSVLYRNSSTYSRYRSMYGSLRKTSTRTAKREASLASPLPQKYFDWSSRNYGSDVRSVYNAKLPSSGIYTQRTYVPGVGVTQRSPQAQILKPGTTGLDYAWTHVNPDNHGAKYVLRYISNDRSKDLSLSEARKLGARGIGVGVVYETTAGRALSGYNAGINDAKAALRRASELRMPGDRPIYFAVDTDTSAGAVKAYFQGVNKVMGGNRRVGVYGGYNVVKGLHQMGLTKWQWQTSAWSGGRWYSGNHVEQYKYRDSHDYNRAKRSDVGTWIAR